MCSTQDWNPVSEIPLFIRQLLENDQHVRLVAKVTEDRQNHLIQDLKSEDLATVSHILAGTVTDAPPAAYWIGRIEQELITRGVCESCGLDHDAAELSALAGELFPTETIVKEEQPVADKPEWVQPELDLDGTNDEVDTHEPSSLDFDMEKWNVRPIYPGSPFGEVECRDCGWASVNLKDRMLRPPGIDGCPGCQDRSAHG